MVMGTTGNRSDRAHAARWMKQAWSSSSGTVASDRRRRSWCRRAPPVGAGPRAGGAGRVRAAGPRDGSSGAGACRTAETGPAASADITSRPASVTAASVARHSSASGPATESSATSPAGDAGARGRPFERLEPAPHQRRVEPQHGRARRRGPDGRAGSAGAPSRIRRAAHRAGRARPAPAPPAARRRPRPTARPPPGRAAPCPGAWRRARHGQVLAVVQRVVDEPDHAPDARLDEHPHAVGVEVLDELAEAHAARCRGDGRGRASPSWSSGNALHAVADHTAGSWRACRGSVPSASRTAGGSRRTSACGSPVRNGSSWPEHPLGLQALLGDRDRRLGAAHDDLVRAVVVGDGDVGQAGDGSLGDVDAAPEGQEDEVGHLEVAVGDAVDEPVDRLAAVTASATSMAVHSPRLCPTMSSGRTPQRREGLGEQPPDVHDVGALPLERRRSGAPARRRPRSARRRRRRGPRTSGSTPGKANATRPPAAIKPSGANHTSLRPRHALPRSTTLRASVEPLGRGIGDGQPHGPARAGAPSRSEPASTAPSSASCAATAARSVPVARNSRVASSASTAAPGAGRRRRGRPQRTAGASSWSTESSSASSPRAANGSAPDGPLATPSRITWALMPPKPKALTPARRGRAVVAPPAGRADQLGSGWAEVGVRFVAVQRRRDDPWCTANAALISPAMPLAGMAWPIIDFTEPSPTGGSSAPSSCRRRAGGWRSRRCRRPGSPMPCASISPTRRRVELRGVPGPLEGQHLPLAGRAHQRAGPAVARHAGPPDRRRRPGRRRVGRRPAA